jgi:hypothetical protein
VCVLCVYWFLGVVLGEKNFKKKDQKDKAKCLEEVFINLLQLNEWIEVGVWRSTNLSGYLSLPILAASCG